MSAAARFSISSSLSWTWVWLVVAIGASAAGSKLSPPYGWSLPMAAIAAPPLYDWAKAA